jgi:ankyrin repeat protein
VSVIGKSLGGVLLLTIAVGAAFLLAETYQGTHAVRVSDNEGVEHRLTEHEPIYDPTAENLPPQIDLELVVDTEGNVVSAIPVEFWKGLFQLAFKAATIKRAKTWKYRPFLGEDGKPIVAKFQESAPIFLPERRLLLGQPFPQIKDLHSLRIKLRRTACFGSCPDYTVEVRGDGSIVFTGKSYIAVAGEHHGRISHDDLQSLLEAFRAADYFSLEDRYVSEVTDCPTYITAIAFDGWTKSVVDYEGERAGMPAIVAELEKTIDRLSGTDKWITGTAETASSLEEEKFDFKAHPSLLSQVASEGSLEAVSNLLSAGAVTDGEDQRMNQTALVNAASRGETEMVRLLIQAGAGSKSNDEKGKALLMSAASGKFDVVKLLLSVGANPDYVDPDGRTVLMFAAGAGVPEVVTELLRLNPDVMAKDSEGETALMYVSRTHTFENQQTERKRAKITAMLIDAGADVNARDKRGDSAVMDEYFDAEIVRELILHGAEVNFQNESGETALSTAVSPGVVRLLLQAGADPSARALSHAKQYGLTENVALIESAMAGSVRPRRAQ